MSKKTSSDYPILIVLDAGNAVIKIYVFVVVGNTIVKKMFKIQHAYEVLTGTEWSKVSRSAGKTMGGSSGQRDTAQFSLQLQDGSFLPLRVGRGAALSTKNTPLIANAKYVPGGIDALLVAVLLHAFPEWTRGHQNIFLACGIPPSQTHNIEHVAGLLRKRHNVIMPDGSKRQFNVKRMLFFKESSGGMVSAMGRVDTNGRFHDRGGKLIDGKPLQVGDDGVVIDSGGRIGAVTAFEIVRPDQDKPMFAEIQEQRGFSSIEDGIIPIRERLRESLKETHEQLRYFTDDIFTDKFLDDILATRQILIDGGRVVLDCRESVDEAVEPYLSKLVTAYNRMGGALVRHIFLTGGGIRVLLPYIVDVISHDSIRLCADPDELIFANAIGGMSILTEQLYNAGQLPDVFDTLMKG